MTSNSGKRLRIVAIVFFGLTAAMNLLGGAGTVCAAFLTKQYPPMWALYEYQWLYQTLMITTILLALVSIWMLVRLIKREDKSYNQALILLIIGTVLGAVHMYASLKLRGKAVPANMKLYANLVTLIIFLILRLPGIWKKINFYGSPDEGEGSLSGGLTAFISGLVTLSVFFWAGPSHTFQGVNWVELFDVIIMGFGWLLTIGGLGLLARWLTLVLRPERKTSTQTSG